MTDRVLIVDFGSQVTQLIARRVRENGVYCEIHPYNKVTADSIAAYDPKGIILSGGPASVTAETAPRAPDAIFETGLPVLGICYGPCARSWAARSNLPIIASSAARSSMSARNARCSRASGRWVGANRYG